MDNQDLEYKRRLLVLADKLDTLPLGRFNFARWAGNDWKGAPDLSCGTSACALGWSTTIPEFRALGLRLYMSNGIPWVGLEHDMQGVSIGTPEKAAEYIFGLNQEEFDFLFIPREEQFDSNFYHENEIIEDDCNARKQFNLFDKIAPSKIVSAKEEAEHIRYFVNWKYGT